MVRIRTIRFFVGLAFLGVLAAWLWRDRLATTFLSFKCCSGEYKQKGWGKSGIKHLACIMDGNRRWAKERGLPSSVGHEKGVEPIRKLAEYCVETEIKYLTLYTWSLENFKRSETEQKYLWALFPKVFTKWGQELIEKQIKVRFLGDRSRFPQQAMATINEIEQKTQNFDKLHINFLFCYGAQQDITEAARKLVCKVKSGLMREEDINEQTFENELCTGDMPPPDLIIRTGKHSRLSNYLLYQAAYSDLAFPDCYWPDFTPEIVEECVAKFKCDQKNFGA